MTSILAGGGVGAREAAAQEAEARGEITYAVISNDGTVDVLVKLNALKNIFAAQLPKMPREYIVRLVFDRRHESLMILRHGTDVLGGICYRPFVAQRFAEIAFCAVTAAEQVRGFGTRVMNHLKERSKTRGLRFFLTYADNHAKGYFRKQGFSADVTLPRGSGASAGRASSSDVPRPPTVGATATSATSRTTTARRSWSATSTRTSTT